jgi:hypothetical protein
MALALSFFERFEPRGAAAGEPLGDAETGAPKMHQRHQEMLVAIYNFIMLGLALLNVILYRDYESSRKAYYIVLFGLIVFVTFRWEVGCDFYSYKNQYYGKFGVLDFYQAASQREPGYALAVYFLKSTGFSWESINVLAAASFFFGIHTIARREPNPLLYITLLFPIYIVGLGMSAVRQCLASGFICLAFNALADKKLLRYILFVAIGGTFHNSALVFLPLATVLFPGGAHIKALAGLVVAAPVIFVLAGSSAAETYSSLYVNSGIEAEGGRFRALPIAATGLVFLLWLRVTWKNKYPQDYMRMLIFSFGFVLVLPLVFYSSVMGDRFGYYLMPLAYLAQARAYKLFHGKVAFPIFFVPQLIDVVYLLAWCLSSWIFSFCYVPYQTWLGG